MYIPSIPIRPACCSNVAKCNQVYRTLYSERMRIYAKDINFANGANGASLMTREKIMCGAAPTHYRRISEENAVRACASVVEIFWTIILKVIFGGRWKWKFFMYLDFHILFKFYLCWAKKPRGYSQWKSLEQGRMKSISYTYEKSLKSLWIVNHVMCRKQNFLYYSTCNLWKS